MRPIKSSDKCMCNHRRYRHDKGMNFCKACFKENKKDPCMIFIPRERF